jgi:hypothetical protein
MGLVLNFLVLFCLSGTAINSLTNLITWGDLCLAIRPAVILTRIPSLNRYALRYYIVAFCGSRANVFVYPTLSKQYLPSVSLQLRPHPVAQVAGFFFKEILRGVVDGPASLGTSFSENGNLFHFQGRRLEGGKCCGVAYT